MSENENKNEKVGIPTVAIVGRPNVGKSALFNAIIGKRVSIVHEESGVTRDNIVSPVKFRNHYFQLIDTGGLSTGKTSVSKKVSFFDTEIAKQVNIAIESADVILFVVDVTVGIHPLDEEVSNTIRKSSKKIIVVVNKADNPKIEQDADVFNRFGIEEIYCVSCLHRIGITRLVERVIKYLPEVSIEEEEKKLLLSVVGRPNVGKSSLLNKLIGQQRVIVSDVSGTTRDAVDFSFELISEDEVIPATLIDTAGLRKKGRADTAVEIFSIMRAKEAIERSDIVLFVMESSEMGATAQDAMIGRLISDAGKGCIIVANKWDNCNGLAQKDITLEIRRTLPVLSYAPIVFTCAVSGYNFKKLNAEIIDVHKQFKVKIPTSALNDALSTVIERNAPPCVQGKFFKIYYGTMVANKPPLFSLFVNDPKLCPAHYSTYLKNSLKKLFGLNGLPIHFKFVKRPKKIESKTINKSKFKERI